MTDLLQSRVLTTAVLATLAAMAAQPGPAQQCVAWNEETAAPYGFFPGDVTTANSWTVVNPTGGTAGRWKILCDRIAIASSGGDQAARLQAAFNACAGVVEVHLRADTFQIASPVDMPNGLVLIGEGQASSIFSSSIVSDGVSSTAPLRALQVGVVGATTVNAANTLGTRVLVSVGDAGGALVPGAIFAVVDSATGSGFQGNTFTVVTISAGPGPFTITVDRPIWWQFGAGDAISVRAPANVPSDIQIKNLQIAGTGTRLLQIAGARRCLVEDVRFSPAAGLTDIIASFDTDGYENIFRRCWVDGQGHGTDGLALETQERSLIENCVVERVTSKGIHLFDCVQCIVVDSAGLACNFGLQVTADGNVIGCADCRVERGEYNGNTTGGISVDSGSTNTRLVNVDARHNPTGCAVGGGGGSITKNTLVSGRFDFSSAFGISISNLTSGTLIRNADCSGSATGLNVSTADVDIDGLLIGGAVSTNTIVSDGTVRARGVKLARTGGAINSVSIIGGRFTAIDWNVAGAAGDNNFNVGAGTLLMSNVRISSGGIGVYLSGAGTVYIEDGCDFSGCANLYRRDAGSFIGVEQFSYGVIGIVPTAADAFPLLGALPVASVPLAVGSAKAKLPGPRTFFSIRADLGAAPGGADTVTATLQKNGVDTTVTVTIAANAITNTTNVQFPPTFAADDFMSLKVRGSALSVGADLRVIVDSSGA